MICAVVDGIVHQNPIPWDLGAFTMDIVLIPGALATSKFWHYQEHFLKGCMRVHHAENYFGKTVSDMAESLLPDLPLKFVLIGFSLGGYIALELMKQCPERVTKLVLINSGAKALSEKGVSERRRSVELIQRGKFELLVSSIFKNTLYDKQKYTELLVLLRSMAYEIGIERYIDQLTAMIHKPDQTDILASIRCPTLLLASKEDQVMPVALSQHMASYIDDVKLTYLENCGHAAPLEQPDLLNDVLLNWL